MPKKYITVTKDMDRLLQKEADRRGSPYAAVVREAIEEWAAARGFKVRDDITWGGPRKTEASDEGQLAGVGTD